jgi:mRNA interferase RelE/StbE
LPGSIIFLFNLSGDHSVGFKGDVKRLTSITPEYRLRVGNYRILFEIVKGKKIIIYRVCHRKDAYKKRK